MPSPAVRGYALCKVCRRNLAVTPRMGRRRLVCRWCDRRRATKRRVRATLALVAA